MALNKQDKILLSITEEQNKVIANTIKTVLKHAPRAASPEAGDRHFDAVMRTDTLISKFKTNGKIPEMVMEAQIAMAKRQAEAQVMRANANSAAIRATIRTTPLLARLGTGRPGAC